MHTSRHPGSAREVGVCAAVVVAACAGQTGQGGECVPVKAFRSKKCSFFGPCVVQFLRFFLVSTMFNVIQPFSQMTKHQTRKSLFFAPPPSGWPDGRRGKFQQKIRRQNFKSFLLSVSRMKSASSFLQEFD